MWWIEFVFISIYALLCLCFWYGWEAINEPQIGTENKTFSIIVPMRNEEENIERLAKSMVNINYPKANFEVLFVDDFSSDRTVEVLKACLGDSVINFKIIDNDAVVNASPKKRAINKAINSAQYEYIVTTDADCEVPPTWLSSFSNKYNEADYQFISAPVTFFELEGLNPLRKLWNRIQIVEFASLVGSAAASIFFGKPNMCSGANISYPKSVFFEVNGFEGNEHLASGDDEFLMQKVASRYPAKVAFLKSNSCIVHTNDQADLMSFYSQRVRWGSKWNAYSSVLPTILALFIFLVNAFTLLAWWQWSPWVLITRFVPEFIFLSLVLKFLGQKRSIVFIPLVQIIYPVYILIIGLAAMRKGKYNWKGRSLS